MKTDMRATSTRSTGTRPTGTKPTRTKPIGIGTEFSHSGNVIKAEVCLQKGLMDKLCRLHFTNSQLRTSKS